MLLYYKSTLRHSIVSARDYTQYKYFLKNLTFVVRISTRVATSPFQSNSLRSQGEEQTTKEQRRSRHDFPSGRPGRTLLFSCLYTIYISPANLQYFHVTCFSCTVKSFCEDSMKTNSFCIFGKYLACHRLGTPGLGS